MKKTIVAFTGILLLGACSQNSSEKTVQKEVTVVETEQVSNVTPTKLLSMEIAGMSCEMGCGSAIRKGLIATGAVERVQFDFKMGRDVNTATISFDDAKISEQELSKIISELNDKQFTIESSTISAYKAEEKSTSSSESETKTKSSGSVGAQSSFSDLEQASFEIKTPNLIDLLLSALVRR